VPLLRSFAPAANAIARIFGDVLLTSAPYRRFCAELLLRSATESEMA
jgi:hypothetical protein